MQANSQDEQSVTLGSGFAAPRLNKLMYSKSEAAELLSLSVRTVEYLIANKELTARRIGKRVLVGYQSLLQFIRRDHKSGRYAATLN
jgi:excisionase family DNA binding protein